MDATDINDLAEKLDGLDLSGDQRAMLDGILARAAMAEPDDVSGFVLGGLDGLSLKGEPFAAALGLLGGAPRQSGSWLEYGAGRRQ